MRRTHSDRPKVYLCTLSLAAARTFRVPDRLEPGCGFDPNFVEIDAHAVLIEPLARLSLPAEKGGGQQFSCRCCVRHGQLESPQAQDSVK